VYKNKVITSDFELKNNDEQLLLKSVSNSTKNPAVQQVFNNMRRINIPYLYIYENTHHPTYFVKEKRV